MGSDLTQLIALNYGVNAQEIIALIQPFVQQSNLALDLVALKRLLIGHLSALSACGFDAPVASDTPLIISDVEQAKVFTKGISFDLDNDHHLGASWPHVLWEATKSQRIAALNSSEFKNGAKPPLFGLNYGIPYYIRPHKSPIELAKTRFSKEWADVPALTESISNVCQCLTYSIILSIAGIPGASYQVLSTVVEFLRLGVVPIGWCNGNFILIAPHRPENAS